MYGPICPYSELVKVRVVDPSIDWDVDPSIDWDGRYAPPGDVLVVSPAWWSGRSRPTGSVG